MIRPLTLLSLVTAFGSGLYLYSEKHRAELLDRQIAHVMRETVAARQATGLLRAEWGLLNNADRLRPMAEKYLNLTVMQPGQWVQLSDLAARLPAVAPPSTSGGTDDGAPAENAPGPAEAPAETPVADAQIAPAPADPGIQDAQAKPAAHPAARLAHTVPRRPVSVAEREAPLHDNPLVHSTPLALATPQPARARVLQAMARPLRTGHPVVVTALPSALGAAAALHAAVPAPVPLGAE